MAQTLIPGTCHCILSGTAAGTERPPPCLFCPCQMTRQEAQSNETRRRYGFGWLMCCLHTALREDADFFFRNNLPQWHAHLNPLRPPPDCPSNHSDVSTDDEFAYYLQATTVGAGTPKAERALCAEPSYFPTIAKERTVPKDSLVTVFPIPPSLPPSLA